MTNKPEEKRAQWRKHITDWRHSGLSQKAYCESHELKTHQFWYWLRQFDNAGKTRSHRCGDQNEVSPGFVPVNVTPSHRTTENGLYLELPNGIRLHGISRTSPETLKRFLQALL